MPKKTRLIDATVISAIEKCKGDCTKISRMLKIPYRNALAFKKNSKFKRIFDKTGTLKPHPSPDCHPKTLKKIGKKKVIDLIMKCGGIAAHVAEQLNVSYMTIYNWKNDPEIAEAFSLAVEANLDLAESSLITILKNAKRPLFSSISSVKDAGGTILKRSVI